MVRPEEKRAGDEDRRKVTERLREALDEGRIDLAEFDERTHAAYNAKTFRELDELTADIPGVVPASHAQVDTTTSAEPEKKQSGSRRSRARHLRAQWSGLGGAALFFTGIWAMTWIASGGSPPYYWPIWVIGPWALGALISTWSRITR